MESVSGISERCKRGEPFAVSGGAQAFIEGFDAAPWSFASLSQALGGTECSILRSETQRFPYFDASRLDTSHAGLELPVTFTGTFDDFLQQLATAAALQRAGRRTASPSQWYLQKGFQIEGNDGAGAVPCASIAWEKLRAIQSAAAMGPVTSVQVFASPADTASPLHYDQLHNFFFQLSGRKRFILFPPAATPWLVPFPVDHPLDRRSQLYLYRGPGASRAEAGSETAPEPETQLLPPQAAAAAARSREIVLEAGDMLYLPPFWWHEVIGQGGENISLSVWLDGLAVDPRTILLQPQQQQQQEQQQSKAKPGLGPVKLIDGGHNH